jgi:hypothetical protein
MDLVKILSWNPAGRTEEIRVKHESPGFVPENF